MCAYLISNHTSVKQKKQKTLSERLPDFVELSRKQWILYKTDIIEFACKDMRPSNQRESLEKPYTLEPFGACTQNPSCEAPAETQVPLDMLQL